MSTDSIIKSGQKDTDTEASTDAMFRFAPFCCSDHNGREGSCTLLGTGHKVQGGGGGLARQNLFQRRRFFVDPPLNKG